MGMKDKSMKEQTIEKIKAAGVVGAGGAGLPTHIKTNATVDTVLVNGKVLMEKGKLLTIDLAKVYAEVNKRAKRLVNNVRE